MNHEQLIVRSRIKKILAPLDLIAAASGFVLAIVLMFFYLSPELLLSLLAGFLIGDGIRSYLDWR